MQPPHLDFTNASLRTPDRYPPPRRCVRATKQPAEGRLERVGGYMSLQSAPVDGARSEHHGRLNAPHCRAAVPSCRLTRSAHTHKCFRQAYGGSVLAGCSLPLPGACVFNHRGRLRSVCMGHAARAAWEHNASFIVELNKHKRFLIAVRRFGACVLLLCGKGDRRIQSEGISYSLT